MGQGPAEEEEERGTVAGGDMIGTMLESVLCRVVCGPTWMRWVGQVGQTRGKLSRLVLGCFNRQRHGGGTLL